MSLIVIFFLLTFGTNIDVERTKNIEFTYNKCFELFCLLLSREITSKYLFNKKNHVENWETGYTDLVHNKVSSLTKYLQNV